MQKFYGPRNVSKISNGQSKLKTATFLERTKDRFERIRRYFGSPKSFDAQIRHYDRIVFTAIGTTLVLALGLGIFASRYGTERTEIQVKDNKGTVLLTDTTELSANNLEEFRKNNCVKYTDGSKTVYLPMPPGSSLSTKAVDDHSFSLYVSIAGLVTSLQILNSAKK